MIKRKENGQSLLEFALVFPLFFFLLILIFDLAYLNYQIISFNTALRNASWKVSDPYSENLAQYALTKIRVPSEQASRLLQEEVRKALKGKQKMKQLEIKNIEMYVYGSRVSKKYRDPYRGEYYRPMYASQVELKAELMYFVDPLTIFGQKMYPNGLQVHKKIYKLRQGGRRGV